MLPNIQKYKSFEVLFGASRRCEAESTTQSLLEHVEQSSCHSLFHLLSLDYAEFSLWMSKLKDAATVPQLTSGERLCTTRTPGLGGCLGVGLCQPDLAARWAWGLPGFWCLVFFFCVSLWQSLGKKSWVSFGVVVFKGKKSQIVSMAYKDK